MKPQAFIYSLLTWLCLRGDMSFYMLNQTNKSSVDCEKNLTPNIEQRQTLGFAQSRMKKLADPMVEYQC
jgi:hypothetical protein